MSVFEPISLPAVGDLERKFQIGELPLEVIGGCSKSAWAFFFSQRLPDRNKARPQVHVFAMAEDLERFKQAVQTFRPALNLHVLPAFDVDPYSGLNPGASTVSQRLGWLHAASSADRASSTSCFFLATVEALSQNTLPFDVFHSLSLKIERGMVLPPDFLEQLSRLGYQSAPTVEDVGQYSQRGGILDVYSSALTDPIRIELFGDTVESLRTFDPESQKSIGEIPSASIIPFREATWAEHQVEGIIASVVADTTHRPVLDSDLSEVRRALSLGLSVYAMDLLLPYCFEKPGSPFDYFSEVPEVWIHGLSEVLHASDALIAERKSGFASAEAQVLRPPVERLYRPFKDWPFPDRSFVLNTETLDMVLSQEEKKFQVRWQSVALSDFSKTSVSLFSSRENHVVYLKQKFEQWRSDKSLIAVFCHTVSSLQRMTSLLQSTGLKVKAIPEGDFRWQTLVEDQASGHFDIAVVPRPLPESFRAPEEKLVFISESDIWGSKRANRSKKHDARFRAEAQALAFGDLKPGDYIVHRLHGIGIYDGLQTMSVDGVQVEYIQLRYKDNDRLYIPVYRVAQLQKYSGPSQATAVDKLGGPGWQKTTGKVKKQVRDIASSLLKLYSERTLVERDPAPPIDDDFHRFEDLFPYDETIDQLDAIESVLKDMTSLKPMDRLVCGDVGFGKTEVAMRAAFRAVQAGRQVAVVAPTTILTFQHLETFKKRMTGWPIEIRSLNRFVSAGEVKKTISDLKNGTVDIVIGTHRLFSRDIGFNNLGLLIVDEEQKFGVAHKEKIRQLRASVDTLVLSATPIPRTLNMSLVGLRDISIINTPPEDRLPTRTFVCKFEEDTVRKAIQSEIKRGGQVFFLHNRVQTIHEVSARVRDIVPEARIAVAHGQMPEDQLEKTMLSFLRHEVDVLISTAIVESGMDIPRANTIFIDQAHQFGVSQLYQLRGRVGRSKERAYCYLIIPKDRKLDADAQERIKIIQENTALGSGIKVAHYDLELRGSGDILGAEQSGHINAVGYEMFMELLDEAVSELRGSPAKTLSIEPEINLRVSAFIPDNYIKDIRARLSFYKSLSSVSSQEDLEAIEADLRDQFGPLPDQVLNLLGVMLIRKICKDLGVKDVSAGAASINLAFTDQTPLPPAEVIRLTKMENKKYSISPDQKLKIRMTDTTWPKVLDELTFLLRLCSKL
jgi:transcription-repair coupling factor (superfamily II helicase)